jgi:hypothetical protein
MMAWIFLMFVAATALWSSRSANCANRIAAAASPGLSAALGKSSNCALTARSTGPGSAQTPAAWHPLAQSRFGYLAAKQYSDVVAVPRQDVARHCVRGHGVYA